MFTAYLYMNKAKSREKENEVLLRLPRLTKIDSPNDPLPLADVIFIRVLLIPATFSPRLRVCTYRTYLHTYIYVTWRRGKRQGNRFRM